MTDVALPLAEAMWTVALKATPGEWQSNYAHWGQADVTVVDPTGKSTSLINGVAMTKIADYTNPDDARHIAMSCPDNVIAVVSDYVRLAKENAALRVALTIMEAKNDDRQPRLNRARVFTKAAEFGWPDRRGANARTAEYFQVTPAAISYILSGRRG
jgi:hypothetical protein